MCRDLFLGDRVGTGDLVRFVQGPVFAFSFELLCAAESESPLEFSPEVLSEVLPTVLPEVSPKVVPAIALAPGLV